MEEDKHILDMRGTNASAALYEGDVFRVLMHSPYVVRSSEFAIADGAIDCTKSYRKSSSQLERYMDVHSRRYLREMQSELMLFDVKSTVADQAGNQSYLTTIGQRRRVAFYVCINAADTTFVEIVPNLHQDPSSGRIADEDDTREVLVNMTRVSMVPPSAYGSLDQCQTPYRVPLCAVADTIAAIRRCWTDSSVYSNPYTQVSFPGWKPSSTRLCNDLAPSPSNDQYSAYEATMEIFRIIKSDRSTPLDADFVGLQPRLADFKLIHLLRQLLVQHKLDNSLRAAHSRFDRVTIARGDGDERKWYFHTDERFDFLWYQFLVSYNGSERSEFFLLPERILPDEFYTTLEKEVSFDRAEFRQYRIPMDSDREWLKAVVGIIEGNPHPRLDGHRPLRRKPPCSALPTRSVEDKAVPSRPSEKKGRREYKSEVQRAQRQFFYTLMTECAQRRSGLIVVLATNHLCGDFAFVRYRWTKEEQRRFQQFALPPKYAHELPADVEMVLLPVYSQHAEAYYHGPNMRPRQYRRLDSCKLNRLIIWYIGGPDLAKQPLTPAVIPSEDLLPTAAQRAIFRDNLAVNHNQGDFDNKTPTLSSLMSTGLFAADYAVGNEGVISTKAGGWRALWNLLHNGFLGLSPLQHPTGFERDPATFRCSMKVANQLLADQHSGHGDLHEVLDDD